MQKIFYAVSLLIISTAFSRCDKQDITACTPDKITLSVNSVKGPTECYKQDISLVIDAVGGNAPYRYEINTGQTVLSQSSPIYGGLFPGKMKITVYDKFNCTTTLDWNTTIAGTSPVSYKDHIAPILATNCTLSGCHDGALGADRDWRTVSAIQNKLNHFQRILSLKKMPPPPAPLLSTEDLNKVLCWVAYGAPDN